MSSLFQRDAISRAHQFVRMARECRLEERDQYEAFIEAAIVYGRSALHRLKFTYERSFGWRDWWDELAEDPSVNFFRSNRNALLKEGPLKLNQVIRQGTVTTKAEQHYYFTEVDVPATATVEQHLKRMGDLVAHAHERFSSAKTDPS